MARSFNGTSDFIGFGSGPALAGTGAFSLAFWMKRSANSAVEELLSQRDGGYDGTFVIQLRDTGKIRFMVFGDGAEQWSIISASTVDDDTWHHICLVRESGGTGRIFIDGVDDANATGTNKTLDATFNVTAGKDDRGDLNFYGGSLSSIFIFDGTALNADQIQGLMRNQLPLKPDSWWELYGVGSPEPDWSGNRNSGTLTGTAQADHAPVPPPFGFDFGWQGAFTAVAGGGGSARRRVGISAGQAMRR